MQSFKLSLQPNQSQFTAVKMRHPLTVIRWLYCGLIFSTKRRKQGTANWKSAEKCIINIGHQNRYWNSRIPWVFLNVMRSLAFSIVTRIHALKFFRNAKCYLLIQSIRGKFLVKRFIYLACVRGARSQCLSAIVLMYFVLNAKLV